jgi:hypothetical protein
MTYPPPIDYSDRLAKVSVHLEILRDRDPSGRWASNALVKKWLKCHYSLTMREFSKLETVLEQAVKRATAPKFEQLTLLGGANES